MGFNRQNSKIDSSSILSTGKTIEKNEREKEEVVNSAPVKELIQEEPEISIPVRREKVPMAKTSLRLSAEAKSIINDISNKNNLSINSLINIFLEQIYDSENDYFTIEIPKKEKKDNKTVATTIPEDIAKALKRQAENKRMSIGEYCSALILKGLSNK